MLFSGEERPKHEPAPKLAPESRCKSIFLRGWEFAADQTVRALTAGGCRTIKGLGNLIHFSGATEKRPQREPEPFTLLPVPLDYLRFSFFLVPKPTPPTPSRSALRLPSHLPPSVLGSGSSFIQPSLLRVRELVDENGLQLFSGYTGKKKTKPKTNYKINTKLLVIMSLCVNSWLGKHPQSKSCFCVWM